MCGSYVSEIGMSTRLRRGLSIAWWPTYRLSMGGAVSRC